MRAPRYALIASIALLPLSSSAQQWMELMQDPGENFHDVQAAFRAHWQDRPYERSKGFNVFKRWEWFMEPRTYPSGERPDPIVFARAVKDMHTMETLQGAKSNANWQSIGPASWFNGASGYNPGNGRVNCITVDPGNASIIYLGAPAGGLWRSTDNGQTWTALFNDQPTLGVSGIAIDPSNTQVIYCATGDGDGNDTYSIGVIKSTDGGATWATTGLDWTTTQARTTRTLRMSPTDHLTLICATNHGLWKTSDGGAEWTKVAEGSFHDVEFKPDDPGIVYACGDQFFRSIDGGASFTPVSNGLPAADLVNRMRIAVTPADPFKVYVLCGNEADGGFLGLYRSNDGGSSFGERSTTPNIFGYGDLGDDAGGQSNYDMALVVDPTNANTVWAAGVNVWKSTNGGTSWTILSHWFYDGVVEYTHADIHSLDIYNNKLYCGSDGGIHRSTNGGDNWSDLSTGLEITQFYRFGGTEMDPGLVIAGAQDNGMNLLANGDWTHVLGADGMEGAVDPSDPSIIYGESQNGGINRSDDGGSSFNYIAGDITDAGPWVTPFVIDQAQPQVLLAGFKNLWRSTDNGNSWTQWTTFNTDRDVRAIAIAPSNSNTVYFCNDNWLRRTSNGGGTWQLASNGLPDAAISSIAVDPTDPLTVFVCLSGYSAGNKVFKSADGGANWTNISGNLPNLPTNTIVCQGGTDGGLYIGTDLGVFYIDNTLSNWQPFAQGLPKVPVDELEINYGANKLRAATFGRGIWQTDLFTAVSAPPTASFTFSETDICSGDMISFTDASLGAAPGWSWSFPGGSPATSTDPDPVVTYATSGSYTATLTVGNSFGSDPFSATVPVVILPNRIDISITLDDYPGETSWTITNDATGLDVVGGGPYSGLNPGSTVSEHVCLDHGCYTFTINDVFGDGICCLQGNGQYTVTNPALGTIVTGGAFTTFESTPFCVDLNVGLQQLAADALIDVRPLDNEGSFSLSLDRITGPLRLDVFDALGRAVISRGAIPVLINEPLDLRHADAGMYLVRVERAGQVWNARVVKP